MTVRVYLGAVTVVDGPPQPGDLPGERFFIDASELREIWVDTEQSAIPDAGRPVTFFFTPPLGIGFERVSGTIERIVNR